ncbi:MAG: hypothetical protein K2X00_23325 [Nitrospiraceae bacterium]|nr:hypothetical protein [Nitrospiraceae bacterium]
MTPFFIFAAIAAVPVVWYLLRWTKPRTDKQDAGISPSANAPIVDEVAPVLFEETPLPAGAALAEREETPSQPDEEPPAEFQPFDVSQPQSETVGSAPPLHEENGGSVTSVAEEHAEPSEQYSPEYPDDTSAEPPTVLLPEQEAPPVQNEIVDISNHAAFNAGSILLDASSHAPEENGGVPVVGEETEPSQQSPSKHSDEFSDGPPTDDTLEPEVSLGQDETPETHHDDTQNREVNIPPAAFDNVPQAGYTAFPEEETPAVADEEVPQAVESVVQAEQGHPSVGSDDGDTIRAPQRYRPPPQKAPRPPGAKPAAQGPERVVSSGLSLDIRVRMMFDRFDGCEIRLLPERTPELDNEVEVKSAGKLLHLIAQEEWYEDLQFDDIGDRLRQGVQLSGLLEDHRRARWVLTGRDIYVLASHQRASGVVSTSRLVLGRSHVVLCAAELLQDVEAILKESGCQGYTTLGEAQGLPSGWIGLRGVAPVKPVALDPGIDPFYAIKPASDIEIEFDGGVCVRNSVWLAGFPPRIKLLGEANGQVKVLIDSKEAVRTPEGFLTVDGYDVAGPHVVYCEGLSCSRSYSIEQSPDAWEQWSAYRFGNADFCGPLVKLPPETAGRRVFSVPMTNPLLLGAQPGQIFRCSPRSVTSWKGFVPFDVVWALPGQPLICSKKTSRILQFADVPLALPSNPKQPVLSWCAAILDASRKGLTIDNCSPEGTVRWKEYKKAARNFWRAAR